MTSSRTFEVPPRTLTLWADATCINQQDDAEKGHQVKIMGAIFANAARVLVWLGKEPLGGPPEYGLNREVEWGEERENTSLEDVIVETRTQLNRLISNLELETSQEISYEDVDFTMTWDEVAQFFHRKWFDRLWVIREVGLAKSAIALFGHAAIEFGDLLDFSIRLEEQWQLRSIMRFQIGISSPFRLYPTTQQAATTLTRDTSFLHVLLHARGQEASNGRDRVYALLSHPSAKLPDGSLIVEPDYTLSKYQVYHQVALRLIEEMKTLDILLYITPVEVYIVAAELPTWVPNWDNGSSRLAETPLFVNELLTDEHSRRTAWQFSSNRKRIHVRGYIIDAVDEHASIMDIEDKVYVPQLKARDDEAWPLGQALSFRSRSGVPIKDRLCDLAHTLVASYRSEVDFPLSHCFSRFRQGLLNCSSTPDLAGGVHSLLPEGAEEMLKPCAKDPDESLDPVSLTFACHNRRLFSTGNELLGLGSRLTRVGDICCVIYGCPLPLMLRETDPGYQVIGCIYIRGVVMDKPHPVTGQGFVDRGFVLI